MTKSQWPRDSFAGAKNPFPLLYSFCHAPRNSLHRSLPAYVPSGQVLAEGGYETRGLYTSDGSFTSGVQDVISDRLLNYFPRPMHHRCWWVRMKISPAEIARDELHISPPSELIPIFSNLGLARKTTVSPE